MNYYLYYYSSPVRKICPQNRTDFYPHDLNSTPIIAYIIYAYILPVRDLWTARFLRLSFVFTTKKEKNFASPQLRFSDAIFMRQFSRRCRHRRLIKLRTTSHDYAQLSTMDDFIVLSIKLVFVILGVSYSRVLAQRPTGCCSARMSYNFCHLFGLAIFPRVQHCV